MRFKEQAAHLSAVLAAFALVAACSSDDGPSGPAPTASRSVSLPVDTPTGEALQVGDDDHGGLSCLESGGETVDLGLWDDTIIASTPLRITGVRAIGRSGVRAAGGLVASVVGRLPAMSGISEWPPGAPDRFLAKSLDWRARTNLIGSHLDVQRAVLPFVHLRGRPGSVLTAIEFSYLTDAGRVGSMTLDYPIRFSRGKC